MGLNDWRLAEALSICICTGIGTVFPFLKPNRAYALVCNRVAICNVVQCLYQDTSIIMNENICLVNFHLI